MSFCRSCDKLLYVGSKPYQIDRLVCRDCQKNPAVQLRILLEDARLRDFDFNGAWEYALGDAPEFTNGRVRWPHDTTHRREWKEILARRDSYEVWRAAYENEPMPERQRTLVNLALAA